MNTQLKDKITKLTYYIEFDRDQTTSISSDFNTNHDSKLVDLKIWNAYFKFCFIRDPYKWFLSQYSDNMQFTHEPNQRIHILLTLLNLYHIVYIVCQIKFQ